MAPDFTLVSRSCTYPTIVTRSPLWTSAAAFVARLSNRTMWCQLVFSPLWTARGILAICLPLAVVRSSGVLPTRPVRTTRLGFSAAGSFDGPDSAFVDIDCGAGETVGDRSLFETARP